MDFIFWLLVIVIGGFLWAVYELVSAYLDQRSARTYTDNLYSIEEARQTARERARLEAAFRFGGRSL